MRLPRASASFSFLVLTFLLGSTERLIAPSPSTYLPEGHKKWDKGEKRVLQKFLKNFTRGRFLVGASVPEPRWQGKRPCDGFQFPPDPILGLERFTSPKTPGTRLRALGGECCGPCCRLGFAVPQPASHVGFPRRVSPE